jgi:hypothetical protein
VGKAVRSGKWAGVVPAPSPRTDLIWQLQGWRPDEPRQLGPLQVVGKVLHAGPELLDMGYMIIAKMEFLFSEDKVFTSFEDHKGRSGRSVVRRSI